MPRSLQLSTPHFWLGPLTQRRIQSQSRRSVLRAYAQVGLVVAGVLLSLWGAKIETHTTGVEPYTCLSEISGVDIVSGRTFYGVNCVSVPEDSADAPASLEGTSPIVTSSETRTTLDSANLIGFLAGCLLIVSIGAYLPTGVRKLRSRLAAWKFVHPAASVCIARLGWVALASGLAGVVLRVIGVGPWWLPCSAIALGGVVLSTIVRPSLRQMAYVRINARYQGYVAAHGQVSASLALIDVANELTQINSRLDRLRYDVTSYTNTQVPESVDLRSWWALRPWRRHSGL